MEGDLLMSVTRDVIAEAFNIKEEDVSCENCSAHKGDGLFLACNTWGTMVKSFDYCSLFLPKGSD